MHALLDHLVSLVRQHKLTHGRKLRLDSTVVETNIHHPVDSGLLVDGVRMLGWRCGAPKPWWAKGWRPAATCFEASFAVARRQLQHIVQTARRRGEQAADALKGNYRQVVAITRRTVRQATAVENLLRVEGSAAAKQLVERRSSLRPRVEQVIHQAVRRMLQGEQVSARTKLVSLVEAHTAIISKGKPGKPVEFGRMTCPAEVEGGIISEYGGSGGQPR